MSHDFLWRYSKDAPARGRIRIFNRSYYEEALVVRVHQELLKAQKLPPEFVTKRVWDERLGDIAHFEDYLRRQGVIALKFFLNLSKKEQKKRFMKRLDDPDRNWKFSASDVRERRYWDDYMHAFGEAIRTQMVLSAGCRLGDHRGGRKPRPRLSEGRRRHEKGVGRRARRTRRRALTSPV